MNTNRQNHHVAPQLARQAARTIAAVRADASTCYERCDRLQALEAEVGFHPSGNAEGAHFQAAVLCALIEGMEETPQVRAAARLAKQITCFLEEAHGVNRGQFDSYYL